MHVPITQACAAARWHVVHDTIKLRHWSVAAVSLNLAEVKAIRFAWPCNGWHRPRYAACD